MISWCFVIIVNSSILMDCGCNVVRRLGQLFGGDRRDRVVIIRWCDVDSSSLIVCCDITCTFRSLCLFNKSYFLSHCIELIFHASVDTSAFFLPSDPPTISTCSVLLISFWRSSST